MADDADVQKAVETLGHALEEFKGANDEALELKADKKAVDVLITEKVEKLLDVIEKNQEIVSNAGKESAGELRSTKEKITALEAAVDRSGHGDTNVKEELELRQEACDLIVTDHYDAGRAIELEPEEVDEVDLNVYKLYKKHFTTYIRKGERAFLQKMGGPKLETKLLSVDRDTGGGYWVRPEMSARIVKIIFETSPIRQFAAVEQISSDSLELIADENQVAFGWVAEQGTRAESATPDIAKRVIHAHEMYSEPRATQKLLDDAGFNVEAWLATKIADRFARAEATAFVTGTGVGQPRGFTTYPTGTSTGQVEQIASGNATTLTADGLLDLLYSLKSPYLRNARWMAARLTIRDIRKLKDGQGDYLWQGPTESIQLGQPLNILGYPIHQADDMAAVGAGNEPIAFGDFRAAYTIVDRKGIRTLRDPYTAKPFVKFYTTKRVGGDVVNFEAIKLQTVSA